MIKQNTVLLWGLILLCITLVNSCRNDFLQYRSNQNTSQNLALISREISINQSQHKTKLLVELAKSKQILSKQVYKNAAGKIMNFGDSISIDTENVLYIENGPNYHTYTFYIQRSNAQPNDPLENLLLTPLPNGTYKELIVSYYLTQQEKQQLLMGHHVDTKNKVRIAEIENFFQNAVTFGELQCAWVDELMYTTCSGSEKHHNGELPKDLGGVCSASTPSVPYVITSYKCKYIVTTDISDGSTGGGSEPGGGGCDNCSENPNPEPCVQVPTNPTELTTGIGDDGCYVGVPTRPKQSQRTPCDRIKNLITSTKFKSNIISLLGKTGYDFETGYTMSTPLPDTGVTGIINQYLQAPPNTEDLKFTFAYNTYAFMHTHYDRMYPIFSPGDLMRFNDWIIWAKQWNADPANADKQINIKNLTYTVVTSQGKYTLIMDGTDVVPFPNYTSDEMKKLVEDYKDELDKATGKQDYMNVLENRFLKFINRQMNIQNYLPSLKIYRLEEGDYSTEIKWNGSSKVTVPCS